MHSRFVFEGSALYLVILLVTFAIVVNEMPLIFDTVASPFVVFAVVEDLILLVGAGVDLCVGSEFHAFLGRRVESFVRRQARSSSVKSFKYIKIMMCQQMN